MPRYTVQYGGDKSVRVEVAPQEVAAYGKQTPCTWYELCARMERRTITFMRLDYGAGSQLGLITLNTRHIHAVQCDGFEDEALSLDKE